MKVLFISRIYPNKFNKDGRVIHSQAKELLKHNIEVKVIAPIPIVPKWLTGKKKLWSEYHEIPSREIIDGIEVLRPKYVKLPNGLFTNIMEFSFTNIVIKTLREMSSYKFDIIHCHMTYPDGLVLEKVKSFYDVPSIVSSRSSDLDLSFKDNKKRKKMKSIYKSSNLVITPSKQLQSKLVDGLNIQSTYLGNGIYPNELNINHNKALEDRYNDKFMILSISNLIKRKRIEDNIRAVSLLKGKIPNILYIIVGDGPEKNRLVDLVDKLELEKNVLFLGKMEHDLAMEYMQICDVFSLPSIRETFGLVYLEALYFNKPIVLCEGEAIASSLENGRNAITVTKFDYEDIAESIYKLYRDKDFYKKVSAEGNKFVNDNYTWEIIGEKLSMLYNSLIKN